MGARSRYRTRLIAFAAVFAVAAAAFVVVSGTAPAHAQTWYYDYYYAAPAYQSNCSTFSFGGITYSNCPAYPPSNVYYYTSPYDYVPAYGPTYYSRPYYWP
jgi:hypothetical protein